MRHQNTGRQLSRNSSHRAALMRNMAAALLRHETIRTTLPKAKELRRVVEPLITLAREDSVAKRRVAFARLRDDAVVTKLFTDLGPHFKQRPGGYTRILKFGLRAGDKAPMAVMQLVDRGEAQIITAADEHAAAHKAKKGSQGASGATGKPAAKPAKEKKAKAEKAVASKGKKSTEKTAKAKKQALKESADDSSAEKKIVKKPVAKKISKKKEK